MFKFRFLGFVILFSCNNDICQNDSELLTNGNNEECECNDGPRCNNCLLDRLIFVTSFSYQGDFGPLAVADEICQNLLPSKYLSDNRIMRAWLSGQSYDAGTRFIRGKGRYLLIDDQTVVVDSGDDLIKGNLLNPIFMDENGDIREVPVWTNTSANGTSLSSNMNCKNWSTSSVFENAWYGWSTATDFQWTKRDVLSNPEVCAFYAHIYCVEEK